MFKGRNLLIATMHKKERGIAPAMEKALGVHCITVDHFDTDALGTFTGEIERKDDPVTTLRNKCLLALEASGHDLGIASEGSFGPHPSIPFIRADDELVILTDKKNQLEIIGRELSFSTNFNGQEISTEDELYEFARNAKFPSHALILRKSKDEPFEIFKGITRPEKLSEVFNNLIGRFGKAYVETDMRAMYNPTRMLVIEKATENLVKKILSLCPECQAPGFGITEAVPGLPCIYCRFPTRSTLKYIYKCQKCGAGKEERYPHKKYHEEQMYCDVCNP